jgi:hypothetical protein
VDYPSSPHNFSASCIRKKATDFEDHYPVCFTMHSTNTTSTSKCVYYITEIIAFTKYYQGYLTTEDEIARTCSLNEGSVKFIENNENPQEKRSHKRPQYIQNVLLKRSYRKRV